MTVAPSAPRVLLTGISGQDGSYLAELLCAEGAEVHGALRGPLDRPLANLAAVRDRLILHDADLEVPGRLAALIAEIAPDEIYHLAAPAFVPDSWLEPASTLRAITGSGAELLEAVRDHVPGAHVVVASSREIFGDASPSPQDEHTRGAPSTPYGVAKLAVHELVGLMREREGLHVSSAVLYNHESPRRPRAFISRKVTRGVAAISLGLEREITLGDLGAVRDWSSARDIVRALRAMAKAPEPADYVLASGIGRTVRELVETAFAVLEIDPDSHLRIDKSFVRPPEPTDPVGNPARARERLHWSAEVGFEALIAEMVHADVEQLTAGAPA